jgi:cysteine synthase
VATVAPATSTRVPAPTVQSNLRTDIVEFATTLSSDDTVAVVDDVQKVEGVKSAQSSGQAIQVTYDPTKTSLDKIIAAIEDYGVQVKK